MVLLNILPCNSKKIYAYVYNFTYSMNNMLPIDKYDFHK